MARGISLDDDDFDPRTLPQGPEPIYKTVDEAHDDVTQISRGIAQSAPKDGDFGAPIQYGAAAFSAPSAPAPAGPPAPARSSDPRFGDPIQYGAPPDAAPSSAPNPIMRGLKSGGIDSGKEGAIGFAALVADTVGAKDTANSLLKKYKDVHDEDSKDSQDYESFSNVIDGKGNFKDFLGYWAGYSVGQAAQTLGAAAAGAAVGSVLPGAGTLAGALSGAIERGAVQTGIKKYVASKLEDTVAQNALRNAAAGMAEKEATELAYQQAAKSVMTQLGAATALTAYNVAQEGAQIYPDAREDSDKSGEDVNLARVWTGTVAAAALESIGDAINLNGILKATGGGNVIKNIARESFEGALRESSTEASQSVAERWGAGKELASAEAVRDYIDSAAAGAVGGVLFGVLKGAKMSGSHQESGDRQITMDEARTRIQGMLGSTDERSKLYDALRDDPGIAHALDVAGVHSADDPAFDRVMQIAITAKQRERDIAAVTPPTSEERAATTKERGEDVRAAYGETASTGYGVGTADQEPVIRRDSVTVDPETKQLVPVGNQPEPVKLPEDRNGQSGVALAPEDLVARQQGFEVHPAFQVGTQAVANRFASQNMAETFLYGPAKDGKRQGGYADSVPDQEFQIRSGVRPKAQGGGTFYFVESRPTEQQAPAAAPDPQVTANTPSAAVAPSPVEAPKEIQQEAAESPATPEPQPVEAKAPAEAPNEPTPAPAPADAPIAPPEPATQAETPVPQTSAPAPAPATPAKPKRPREASLRNAARDRNPFLAFLAEHGIHTELGKDFEPSPARRNQAMVSGFGRLYRNTGKQIDELAHYAAMDGFIKDEGDTSQLYDKIAKAVKGERVDPEYDPDFIAARHAKELAEHQERQAADDVAHAEDSELFAVEPDLEDRAEQAEQIDAHDDAPWDTPKSDDSLEALERDMRSMGFSEEEIKEAIADETAKRSQGPTEVGEPDPVAPESASEEGARDSAGRNEKEGPATERATEPNRAAEQVDPVDLWEDNDDGKAAHVGWGNLSKDAQRTWRDAVKEGYATIKLHDEIVESHNRNARTERINAKVKRNDDSDFRRSDVDIDSITSVDELNRQVNAVLASDGKQTDFAARRVPVGDLVGKVPGLGSIELIARIFGRKVVFFQVTNGPAFFDGVVLAGNDTIFVNVEASKPHLRIFGHEFVHSIRRTDPDAYNRLVDALHPLLDHDGMDAYRVKQLRHGVQSEAKILEEAVADIVGDRMGEPQFWSELAARDRSTFEKLADLVKAFIDGALLKLQKTLGSERLVTDLKAARKAVADVLSELDTQHGEQTGDGPSFSRKEGEPFYSALHRAVGDLKINKPISAKAWLGEIKGFIGNRKAKEEEVAWTGVRDWLELQGDRKMPKEEVQAYLDSSAPEINRIILTERYTSADLRQMLTQEIADETGDYNEAEDQVLNMPEGYMVDELRRRLGKRAKDLDENAKHGESGRNYVLPGGENYAELVVADKKIESYLEGDEIHFGDTSKGQAVGWLRMNERRDANGVPTLFIEEVQSKRAQDKRKVDERKKKDPEGLHLDVPPAPFISDTKSWVTYLLKHAVYYAHEHGIAQIAWTTGEQQTERYSLRKSVDSIAYVHDKKTGKTTVTGERGNRSVFERETDHNNIDELVGDDVATAINSGKHDLLENEFERSGVVPAAEINGGRGMASFYEGIVPQAADKFLKQFDGKTEQIEIEGLGQQPGFRVPVKLSETIESDGLPMFSRKDYEAQFADLPERVRAMAMAKGKATPPTIKDRLAAYKPRALLRLTQGVVDQYRSVKNISEQAYMKLSLSTSVDGALEGLLHFGQVTNDGGALNVKKGTKGLIDALKPVGGETDRFLLWIAANRARNLKKQEREHFFKDEEIAALTRLNAGSMKDGRSRAAVYAESLRNMNDINRSVLDVARSSGLIDPEAYKRFSDDIWYVPFYRQMDDDRTLSAAQHSTAAVGQYLSKKLKGSERPLNDLMENVLLNWSHILSASMKNEGAVDTLKAASAMKIVTKLEKQGDYGRDGDGKMHKLSAAVKVMEGGRESHYLVHDEFLLQSLKSVEGFKQNVFVDVMRPFKTALTRFVALSPTFKINNLIRDSIQSVAVSEINPNFFKNVTDGVRAYHKGRAEALFGGGLFTSGAGFDGDMGAATKRLVKMGVREEDILDSGEKAKAFALKAWEWYHEKAEISENANRLALYRQLREGGASHLEAAYAARDLQDFHRQGAWGVVRGLNQVLPYFNARLQGLYKLGRGARENTMRFATVTGSVAMFGIALYLMHKDDDEWKNREQWDRDNYFWIKLPGMGKAVRIPKPFEIGAIATVAERAVEQIVDSGVEGKVFANRLWHVLKDNLAINPMPQMLRPLWDVAANKDSFTDRQIESEALKRMSVENRANPNTSAAGVALGKVNGMIANSIKNATGIDTDGMKFSPAQYDFMMRGYFGWLGAVIQASSDIATSPFKPGELPEKKIDDYFVVGNFIRSLPQSQSHYVSDFYDSAREASQVAADFQHYKQLGEIDKARDLAEKQRDTLALAKVYASASETLAKISAQIKKVQDSETMSASEKRQQIDNLDQLRNQYARRVEEARIARAKAR